MKEKLGVYEIALIIIFIFILIGILLFIWAFIGMLIDHECYQLEPNEFYQSSICERYWNYED